jgi:DNA (cytosine-5)-methyltransferase 1
MLTSRGLGRVLGDLATMGFDAKWGVLGAADVGAVHQRDRIWIVGTNFSNPSSVRFKRGEIKYSPLQKSKICTDQQHDKHGVWSEAVGCVSIDDWKSFATKFFRVDDGMADRVDRLKAIGNGQVPLCAATAWRILTER